MEKGQFSDNLNVMEFYNNKKNEKPVNRKSKDSDQQGSVHSI